MNLHGWRQPKRGHWRLEFPNVPRPAAITCGTVVAIGLGLCFGWWEYIQPWLMLLPVAMTIPAFDDPKVQDFGRDLVRGRFLDTGGAVFNVKAFGAVGDGVTDDTAAIAAALAAASSGGVILFPPGNYLHTGITVSTAETVLQGATSRWGTTPTFAPVVLTYTGAGTAITLSGTNCVLRGLQINNTGTGTVGVQINASYCLLEDVAVSPSTAFTTAGIAYSTSLTLFQCLYRVYVRGAPIGIDVPIGNSLRFRDVHIVFPTTAGIRLGNTAAVLDARIDGLTVDLGTGAAATASGILGLRASSVTVSNFYCEVSEGVSEAGQLCIALQSATANAVSNWVIENGYCNGGSDANYAIELSGTPTSITIRDLRLRDFVTAGINNILATNCSVYNNYISGATPAVLSSTTGMTTFLDGNIRLMGGSQVHSGAGVPAAGLGGNGHFYLRTNGAGGSALYYKSGGAWAAIA